jgi:SAM-dependent methyltransferase
VSTFRCPCCGGTRFRQHKVLWDELVEGWGLSPQETEYIDEQQGLACEGCGSRLRSMALARAISESLGWRGRFRSIGYRYPLLRVLEVNAAGDLTKFLQRFPRHQLAAYPDVDLQNLPYAANSFDLVVHSDTLEHVPDPLLALREVYRVLNRGGRTCFTVPIVVARQTSSTEGKPPTYHGAAGSDAADMLVRTEYGADAWTQLMEVGFDDVRLFALRYPAGLALVAQKH